MRHSYDFLSSFSSAGTRRAFRKYAIGQWWMSRLNSRDCWATDARMYRSRSTPWPNEELICTNTLVLRSAHRARPGGIEGGANDIQQFAVVRRFLQESGGARFQGPFTIELRIACGQDNYGNRRERGALLQTIEHNEAVPGG